MEDLNQIILMNPEHSGIDRQISIKSPENISFSVLFWIDGQDQFQTTHQNILETTNERYKRESRICSLFI